MKTMKFSLFSMGLLFLVSCGAAETSTNRQDYNNPEGRKQYARGLDKTAQINNGSASFEAYDVDSKTLFVRSNSINQADCEKFAKSEFAMDAKSIGFEKVICRNEDRKDQWSFPL